MVTKIRIIRELQNIIEQMEKTTVGEIHYTDAYSGVEEFFQVYSHVSELLNFIQSRK